MSILRRQSWPSAWWGFTALLAVAPPCAVAGPLPQLPPPLNLSPLSIELGLVPPPKDILAEARLFPYLKLTTGTRGLNTRRYGLAVNLDAAHGGQDDPVFLHASLGIEGRQ